MHDRTLLACTLLSFACLAFGQNVDRACSLDVITFSLPPIAAFDVDGDGLLEEAEASGCDTLQVLFDRLDLDANGYLTRVEYRGFAALWEQRSRSVGGDTE
ncbi:MAG: hypothetical protein JXB36_16580 [Gammaproteobacteria bacterium]|nr:hypothetical protein [Gammaproteobacteria bacterium]